MLVLMISRQLSVTGDSATEVRVGLLSSAIRQCLLGGTATPSVEERKMKFLRYSRVGLATTLNIVLNWLRACLMDLRR